MKIVLEDESTFIDVGSHKGEVLDEALKISKKGKHFAFEPIPDLFEKLHDKYGSHCEILNCGLSDQKKQSSFQYVTSNPAYSGIRRRTYPKNEEIQTIQIQLDTLDNQLKLHDRVDLIKIDVEGFELDVLMGLSQKVGIISFEFTSEFFDQTTKCLKYLKNLGYEEFNFSIGERRKFFSKWSNTEDLIRKLRNEIRNDKLLWGDIYCK